MRKAYSILAFALLCGAVLLVSNGSRAQTVAGPTTAPSTAPVSATTVNNDVAALVGQANSQIQALGSALGTANGQVASLTAQLTAAQTAANAATQPSQHTGWLCTNAVEVGYATSNIYANICQQSSGFYNVGDAPACTYSANGYPVGATIHARSQNWLYDVAAAPLNVTWAGTATLNLSVYAPVGAGATWKVTGANSGTLTLGQAGASATQPANNSPTLTLWIDCTSSSPTNPLNNLCIWQPGYGPGTANAGLMFRKDFTTIARQYAGMRFMAMTNASASAATQPSDLVSASNYDQTTNGCSYANCIELAKEANLSRVWFCLPVGLDVAGQQQIAQQIHDGLPNATVIIEVADEPFNSGAGYAFYPYINTIANTTSIGKYDGTYNAAGQFVPTAAGQPYVTDSLTRMVRAAADLERTIGNNIRPIFADNPSRLKVVLSGQAGNVFWVQEGLKWINAVYGNTSAFDAITEAPYFTFWPDAVTTTPTGPNGAYQLSDLAQGVQSDFVRYVIPQVQAHTAVAKQYGKLHFCYEAGQTFYPQANPYTGTDLSSQYNYSREIAKDYALYYFLLKSYGVDLCFDFALGPGYWNEYGYWSVVQDLNANAPTGPTSTNYRYVAQQQIISLWN